MGDVCDINPQNESLLNTFIYIDLEGDTMQRIYSDGKEKLGEDLPEDWLKPVKSMNHRSESRIIELNNKIRKEIDG